jgi:hypothetical protein
MDEAFGIGGMLQQAAGQQKREQRTKKKVLYQNLFKMK